MLVCSRAHASLLATCQGNPDEVAPGQPRGVMRRTPQLNAEVTVRWGGVLDEDEGWEFREPKEEAFWLGDPAMPVTTAPPANQTQGRAGSNALAAATTPALASPAAALCLLPLLADWSFIALPFVPPLCSHGGHASSRPSTWETPRN